jgi:Fur family transcriptional regulator, ferric uptake regulator
VEAKDKFDRYIDSKGMRRTAPRDTVVNVFLKTEKHVSTQDLYNIVSKKDKDIGYATVARTLKLIDEAGLCRKVDFGDGTIRYEHKYKHDHHDHLVCTGCGRLVEIYDKKLEKIQEELVKKHGYVQETHRLNIFGLCPKCQKTKGKRR